MNTAEAIQFNKMTKTPVKKLVLSLGIPTIISMLVTAIYNMADTYFVGKLGNTATGAVGVIFSLQAIVQAIGFTLGMGGGNMISSLLGQRKEEEAQKTGSSSFYLAIALGIIIATLGTIFISPIVKLICTSADCIPYAIDYGFYILLGAPLMTGSFVMNNLLRAEGKSRFAMIGLTTGGIINMFLDPLFINTFGLGVKGAAIATIISQAISFSILLFMFISRRSIIHLSFRYISKRFSTYFEVIKLGLPSLARQGLASIASLLINGIAGNYGASVLAGMIIVSKVFMMMFAVCLGIGQGYQPVCGYNYFAKKYDRVKEAMIFTFFFQMACLLVVSSLVFIFSKEVVTFFTTTESYEAIKVGSTALRYQCVAIMFIPINTICNMTYQSIRKKFLATLLSCLRQGLFFIPCVFILPALFGVDGVMLVQSISDLSTCLFSIPFFFMILKHLKQKQLEMQA